MILALCPAIGMGNQGTKEFLYSVAFLPDGV